MLKAEVGSEFMDYYEECRVNFLAERGLEDLYGIAFWPLDVIVNICLEKCQVGENYFTFPIYLGFKDDKLVRASFELDFEVDVKDNVATFIV